MQGDTIPTRSGTNAWRRAAFLTAAVCPVIAAHPAVAQVRQQQQQTRHIDLDAAVKLQYDSDVLLSDSRTSSGRPRDDISAAPSLNVDLFLPRAGGDIYLTGSAGYNFYRRYTRLNRERINLTAGADQRLAATCIAHVEGSYARQLSDIGNVVIGTPAESINNTEEDRSISGDIGCGGAIGLRPSIAVSHAETRNSTALRRFADANTTSLTGQLGYGAPAIGTIALFGRYSNSSYLHRPTPSGERDGVKSYAAGVQLERTIGTRLNFRGSVNYTKVDPKLSATRKFSGIGYDLSATYSGDFFQIAVIGSRAAQPSQLIGVSYDVQTTIGATFTKQLTTQFTWNAGANYRHRQFVASPAFPVAVSGSEDVLTLSTGLAYRATRRLRFSLDGSYQKRTSDVQLFGYDVKRVSLTTFLAL